MTVPDDTLAVIGSSPFAAFLAGLLASDQKKRVTLVRDSGSRGRLAENALLTFAPMTRPESWALFDALLPEAIRALSRFKAPVLERCDLHLTASAPEAVTALSHVGQTAFGFDVPLEPVTLPGVTLTLRILDRYRMLHEAFWTQVPAWLAEVGVTVVAADRLESVEQDGSTRLAGTRIEQTILADDGAVAAHFPMDELLRLGRFVPQASILTEPAAGLPARLAFDLDSGATVHQRQSGAVQLFGPISEFALPPSLAPLLGRAPIRLAGRARYRRFLAEDGAAVIGRVRRHRAMVIAGLGPAALVLAPAIARWIAGDSPEAEAAWIAARRPTRAAGTPPVAEPVPLAVTEG